MGFLKLIQDILYRHLSYIVLVILLSFSLFLFSIPENKSVQMLRVVGLEVVNQVHYIWKGFTGYFLLHKKNQDLIEENKSLTMKLQTLLSLQQYVYRDGSLTKYYFSHLNKKMQRADVIDQQMYSLYNFFTISLGSINEIALDMVVLNEDGLIGKVVLVSPHYSIVQPIINKDFKIGVTTEKSQINGILEWSGNNHQIAKMSYVSKGVNIYENEMLYTSTISSIATYGIPIGRIKKISSVENSFFYDVQVDLAVNFMKLDYVFVGMQKKMIFKDSINTYYQNLQHE